MASIPGIRSVSVAHQSVEHPQIVRADGPGGSQLSSRTPNVKAVDPGYFASWGIRLVLGRSFNTADDRAAPLVAIVNKAAAAMLWPGQNPVGRQLVVGDSNSVGERLVVIGVAANAERGPLVGPHWPTVYRPFGQARIYHPAATLTVRVTAGKPGLFAAAQTAIRQATNRTAIPFDSEEERLSARLLAKRFNAIALNLFAGFGLLLAAMGIYGSIAYAVTQRTREIGVRMALGAKRGSVLGLVARRGVLLAIAGVSLGSAGAFALTRVLRSFLVGTSATNPWVFAGSGLLMIAIALIATFLPARRATQVDPVMALRAE